VEIWEPKPPGTPWATPGLLLDSFFTDVIADAYYNSNNGCNHKDYDPLGREIVFEKTTVS